MQRRTLRSPVTWLTATLLALVLAACGTTAVPVGTTLGPAGGSVSSSDGNASLDVPAGALGQETTVALAGVANPPAAPAGFELVPGSAYRLDVDGVTTLAQGATLTITVDVSGQATRLASSAATVAPAATSSYTIALYDGATWNVVQGGTCSETTVGTLRCEASGIVEIGMYAVFRPIANDPGILVQSVNGMELGSNNAVTVDAGAPIVVGLLVTAGSSAIQDVTVTVDGTTAFTLPLPHTVDADTQAEVAITIAAGTLPARSAPYGVVLSATGVPDSSPISVTVTDGATGSDRTLAFVAVNGEPDFDGMTIYSDQSITFTLTATAGPDASSICQVWLFYNDAASPPPTGITDEGWNLDPCVQPGGSLTFSVSIPASEVANIIQFIPPHGGLYNFYFGTSSDADAGGSVLSAPATLNLQAR